MVVTQICQNDHETISCGLDNVLDIIYASYGRSSKFSRCGWSRTAQCHSQNSMIVVWNLCQGKSSCWLTASNMAFGNDPCPTIPKYLKVEYECGRRSSATSPTGKSLATSSSTATTVRSKTTEKTTARLPTEFPDVTSGTTHEISSSVGPNKITATGIERSANRAPVTVKTFPETIYSTSTSSAPADTLNLGVILGSIAVGFLLVVVIIAAFVVMRRRTISRKSNATIASDETENRPSVVASFPPITESADMRYETIKDDHLSNTDGYITPRVYPNDSTYAEPSVFPHPAAQPPTLSEISGYHTVTISPGNDPVYTQYDVKACGNKAGQEYEVYEKISEGQNPKSSLAEEPGYQAVDDGRKAINDDSSYIFTNI